MDERIFELILTIIPVLGTIITVFIVPYIKEKIGNEKLAKYEYWVDTAVHAAEMLFTESGSGEKKKEYVINFLMNMFNKNKINITKEQMEILIEATVKQLKLEEK